MRSYVWHPYTQMNEWPNFDVIVRGKGMWLYDSKGNRMLDGVASMWCNVWGHSRDELVKSMIKQTRNCSTRLFSILQMTRQKSSHQSLSDWHLACTRCFIQMTALLPWKFLQRWPYNIGTTRAREKNKVCHT
ncbi:Adenosylmethionine-8-amino-7-oxononanoate aminotransferase [Candidatus Nitrosotalea sp. TS]|nr:Adenosylmethionine-8-amino-7-oxononanoate aminotransferase [Candidatus Nitrosotalea sp. TS]